MEDIKKIPLFILAAYPGTEVLLPRFFEKDSDFYKKLENPTYLRRSGWNLLTLDTPRIRHGNFWEVRSGDKKIIHLYQDGFLIASVFADNTFLSWGQNDEEFMKFPRLNTLAVIEYVYEFVNFYVELFKNFTEINFIISMKNSTLENGKKLLLAPLEIRDFRYGSENLDYELEKDFDGKFSIKINEGDYDPKYISYKVLSIIFANFGIPADEIPYTLKDKNGNRYVDIEKIKAIS